jgi:hypothetical protein
MATNTAQRADDVATTSYVAGSLFRVGQEFDCGGKAVAGWLGGQVGGCV